MARVTKRTMMATYNLLKLFPPFRKWSLPPSSRVQFVREKERGLYGSYLPIEGKYDHRIGINPKIGMTKFVETMAHEMCHMKQVLAGNKSMNCQGDWHDKDFRNLARQVCKHMGYKLREF